VSSRRPITLTKRGERVLAAAYTLLITITVAVGLLLMLGLAGAIENGLLP